MGCWWSWGGDIVTIIVRKNRTEPWKIDECLMIKNLKQSFSFEFLVC